MSKEEDDGKIDDDEDDDLDDDSDDENASLAVLQRKEQKDAREKETQRFFAMLDRIRSRLRVRRSATAFATTPAPEWDRICRVKDIHVCIFSFVGLVVSMLMSVYKWEMRCIPDSNGDCHPDWSQDDSNPNIVAASADNTFMFMQDVFAKLVGCQVIVSVSSLVTVFLLVQYYGLKVTERQREWSGVEEVDRIEASGEEKTQMDQYFRSSYKFWDSSLRWALWLEIAIHCFYPLLWFESLGSAGSTIEEVAESFVFVRLYLLLRVAYESSDAYKYRAYILKANKELQVSGYRVNPVTTFKVVFYRRPLLTILCLTTALWLVFSFAIFVIERNNNAGLSALGNCVWFAFVTLATIGYGDYSAVSPTGRVFVIVMSTLMQFAMVLFGGVVTNLLLPTRELKLVQRTLEQRASEDAYTKAAIHLIETTFLERRKRRAAAAGGSASVDFDSKVVMEKRSPAVYGAIKALRAARLAMRQSLGSATDTVADEKLEENIALAHEMNRSLHQQGLAILFLHQQLIRSCALVKQRLSTGISGGVAKKSTLRAGGRGGGGGVGGIIEKDPVTKRYSYESFVQVH